MLVRGLGQRRGSVQQGTRAKNVLMQQQAIEQVQRDRTRCQDLAAIIVYRDTIDIEQKQERRALRDRSEFVQLYNERLSDDNRQYEDGSDSNERS